MIEEFKKELIKKDHVDKSGDELLNRLARSTFNLKDKKYVIDKDGYMYSRLFNNDYVRLLNDYWNEKIEYEDIVKQKELIDSSIKIYEENKNSFKKSVEEEVINSKKVSKALDEIITVINESKIRHTILLGSLRRLICLGCMIQRCIKKLTM